MLLVLVEKLDAAGLHPSANPVGVGAVLAGSSDLVADLAEEAAVSVIGVGEGGNPLGAGAVEDDYDVVARLFEKSFAVVSALTARPRSPLLSVPARMSIAAFGTAPPLSIATSGAWAVAS